MRDSKISIRPQRKRGLVVQRPKRQLIGLGYEQQVSTDPCLFIHKKTKSAINIHVDDCLVSSSSDCEAKRLKSFFESKECTLHEDEFTYLAMDVWKRKDNVIQVSMETYLRDLMTKIKATGSEDTPCQMNLIDAKDDSKPVTEEQRKEFVSVLMALYFAALRVRFDILFTVSVLSKHCKAPTQKHYDDLQHLIRYVNGTISKSITLDADSLTIHVYADASFMTHPDRKGHTGVVVTMGENGQFLAARSATQKCITTSSTDSEALAAYESNPLLKESSKLMTAFGYPSIPILHQDNISAIHMMETGGGSKKHTKHFDMRLRFLQEMIANYEFTTEYTPTENMLADTFTKALPGKSFHNSMNTLFNQKKYKQQQEQRPGGNTALLAMLATGYVQTLRGCAEFQYVRTNCGERRK